MSRIVVIGIVGNSVFLPVDSFHVGGETIEAKSVHFEFGGKGFNQAIAASRAGAEVSFFAAVGKEYREEIKKFLDGEGISSRLVPKDTSTAFAAIITDKSGTNHVTVYQGAQLSAEDVDSFEDAIAEADILLLTNEVDEAVNIRAIEIAKAHGTMCILNPAPQRALPDYIIENIDLFTPNEHETGGIDGKTNVIVTLGKNGCLLKSKGIIIPAVSLGTVVDTTGAGDTFNGALTAMIGEGRELDEAARIAGRVASLGVTRKYAASSIPTREEIKEIIAKA